MNNIEEKAAEKGVKDETGRRAGQDPGPRAAGWAAMAAVATRALMAAGTPEISTFLYHTPVQYRSKVGLEHADV